MSDILGFEIIDLAVIAVILLSAMIAAWRGFTREVLSIGAWVGAAVVMFVFGPKAEPLAQTYLKNETMAMIAAYAAVFVIALLPLAYISYRISEGVRDSAIGPVDRLLGFAFGAARGLLIVGVGFLVFTSLVGESRLPDWFKNAKLHPLMEATGKVIASLLPERDSSVTTGDDKKDEDPTIGGGKKKPEPAKPSEKAPEDAAPETPEDRTELTPSEPEERTEAAPERSRETAVKPKPAAAEREAPKPREEPVRKPARKDTAEDESAPAQPQGYGERERDALDQLIGSATASPGN